MHFWHSTLLKLGMHLLMHPVWLPTLHNCSYSKITLWCDHCFTATQCTPGRGTYLAFVWHFIAVHTVTTVLGVTVKDHSWDHFWKHLYLSSSLWVLQVLLRIHVAFTTPYSVLLSALGGTWKLSSYMHRKFEKPGLCMFYWHHHPCESPTTCWSPPSQLHLSSRNYYCIWSEHIL